MSAHFLNWLSVYFYNLRLPLLLVAGIGILVCALVAFWSSQTRSSNANNSSMHIAAVERQLVCLKGSLLLAVAAALIWAIPSPTFDQKIVFKDRVVEKRIPVPVFKGEKIIHEPSTYQNVFDKCVSSSSYGHDADLLKMCHEQALTAVAATQPGPQIKERIVYKVSTYKTLFDNCNDNHDGGIVDLPKAQSIGPRNDRIVICHKAAMEGSRFH